MGGNWDMLKAIKHAVATKAQFQNIIHHNSEQRDDSYGTSPSCGIPF